MKQIKSNLNDLTHQVLHDYTYICNLISSNSCELRRHLLSSSTHAGTYTGITMQNGYNLTHEGQEIYLKIRNKLQN